MERKPNIILMMADQLIPFLTGAYGHPVVRTPNLDRLVEQGVRFDSAYTPCPICAPARGSLMTGRYASQIGCYDNAAPLSSDVPTMDQRYSAMDRWLNAFHGTDQVDLCDPSSLYALRRSYYGLVSYVDRKIGELLDCLERNGLDENTIVVFASDHGDMLCEKAMVQKRSFYEWSSRVPLIVRFPDNWQAGATIDGHVSLIDVAPTALDLAGVEERLPMDGLSLMPLLEHPGGEERTVIGEMHCEGVRSPCFMVRQGRYKYVHIHGEDEQLFDLDLDPDEWNDLSGAPTYAAIVERMAACILNRFEPDEIERDVNRSLTRRKLIRLAMNRNETDWAYRTRRD